AANALEAESQSQNGSDGDNGNGGNRNRGNGNGGNGNPNESARGARPVARECTYQDFMKCQPLNFKGTEGVVGLIRWLEKMETVFYINSCPEKYQVKELMKLMAEVYCPRNEIQKMKSEMWNLTMKNNDLTDYTQRFQELTMLCTKMVPGEEDRVEKFIGGLPDNIQGNVIAAKPTKLQDVVRIANNLMDQKLKGYATKNAKNKKRAYTAGQNEKRGYARPLPYCSKCKLHHEVPCTMNSSSESEGSYFFEYGRQGHYRSECPKLKNQNSGNKIRNKNRIGEARGKAYVKGGGDANPGETLSRARIRRIFLDGYGVLVVRIVIFKISSFKLQNARLLLIFTKYSESLFRCCLEKLEIFVNDEYPAVGIDSIELQDIQSHRSRIQQWKNGVKTKEDDLLDVFINLDNPGLTTDQIKAQCFDLMLSIFDSPSNSIEWAMAEMINQPRIFDKAVQELDSVVGVDLKLQVVD
ncbi:putative reverse transcriptase domain-containing protein, partial [Tanacetum coccineum]